MGKPKIKTSGHAITLKWGWNYISLSWRGWPSEGEMVRKRFKRNGQDHEDIYRKAAEMYRDWLNAGPTCKEHWTLRFRDIDEIVVGDTGPATNVVIVTMKLEALEQ